MGGGREAGEEEGGRRRGGREREERGGRLYSHESWNLSTDRISLCYSIPFFQLRIRRRDPLC